MNDLDLCLEVA